MVRDQPNGSGQHESVRLTAKNWIALLSLAVVVLLSVWGGTLILYQRLAVVEARQDALINRTDRIDNRLSSVEDEQ